MQLIGWFGLVGLLLVLVWLALIQLPTQAHELQRQVQAAQRDRQQRDSALTALNAQFEQDESRFVSILKRFPWLIKSAGGTAFLTRLGEVVTGQSLKVLAIGTLQRQETPEWTKGSRQVRLTGRFSDILSLVEKVERNRGILEAVKIQKPQPQGGAPEAPEEIEAQFGLVTVELSEDIRKRLRASIAERLKGSEAGAAEPQGPLLLPVPAASATPVASLRDPFQSPEAISAMGVPGRTTGAPGGTRAPGPGGLPPEEVFPPLVLAGIIESPRGRTAIINNQMVREGERIAGVLVQAIHKHAVMLKSPSAVKHLTLPEFGSTLQVPGDQSK